MTQQEYEAQLEKLYAKADEAGCCVIPAKPIQPPDGEVDVAK